MFFKKKAEEPSELNRRKQPKGTRWQISNSHNVKFKRKPASMYSHAEPKASTVGKGKPKRKDPQKGRKRKKGTRPNPFEGQKSRTSKSETKDGIQQRLKPEINNLKEPKNPEEEASLPWPNRGRTRRAEEKQKFSHTLARRLVLKLQTRHQLPKSDHRWPENNNSRRQRKLENPTRVRNLP